MTYTLYIGNRLYFSWSLAAQLMVDRFGLMDQTDIRVLRPDADQTIAGLLAHVPPARTVPTLVTPEGAVLNDSLAIVEELATRHPDIPVWPADTKARATARALANEMHSGFGGLRSDWAFNIRVQYRPQTPPPQIEAELDRLETLWSHARDTCAPEGPWLCGDYSAVDAIFAPMALRLAGYGFDTHPVTRAYVDAHMADPAFRRWRAMARANEARDPSFEINVPEVPWRGPAPLPARAVNTGPSENDRCPYSGKPVTHFLELDGRTFGFCNAFCRDKTANDPAVWPPFMALV